MEYKSIRIDKPTYDYLNSLAKKNSRKIVDQLRVMVNLFLQMEFPPSYTVSDHTNSGQDEK